MAWSVALAGICVGLEFRPYDFEDRESGKQISGNSVWMSISESFDVEPVKVKVPKDLQEAVALLDPYSMVEVEATLFARQRGKSDPYIEATARRVVAVDGASGVRTDLATGEVLQPVEDLAGAGA